jgi:hypothetical protein
MSKFIAFLGIALLLLPNIGFAAAPFDAPAVFNLESSSIAFSASVETQRLGVRDLAIDPNPAPVTGYLDINNLSSNTGIFYGAVREVTTQTNAEIPFENKSFTITVSISGDSVTGIFLWREDKVVFYPETLTATFTVNGISQSVPFTGIPLPANYLDGVISLTAQQTVEQEVYGYPVRISAAISLVGTMNDSGQNTGQLWLALQNDKDVYYSGDTLTLYASAGNPGTDRKIDFYLLMLDPSGNPFLAPEYTNRLAEFKSAIFDGAAYASPTAVLQIKLPAFTPPIVASGQYQFYAALLEAGTETMASNLASSQFNFDADNSSTSADAKIYDGTWIGTGSSDVVTADCPALAQVVFEIDRHVITGTADNGEDGYEVAGTINDQGEVVDGILLEEFGPNWVPVGSFNGVFSGESFSGRWLDNYGCHGSVSLTKFE